MAGDERVERAPGPVAGSVASDGAARLLERVKAAIASAGGWLPFDRVMAMALYEPGLGYYARGGRVFGVLPQGGSDFVTAPELTPLFAQALAAQVNEALAAAEADTVYEFGAGSGALAEPLLEALGERAARYAIVDLSGALRQRQAARLARFGDRVRWLDTLPERMEGVVIGNELLDAMPVQRLAFDGRRWFERGVVIEGGQLVFADRPTELRPPCEAAFVPGTVTEIHPQAEAWVRTLAARLERGFVLLLDYGFPEAEYYLPARHMGTLMAHQGHRAFAADADLLAELGARDLTSHVNFTGIALAAQEAGLAVLGYTSQANFLLNCGLLERVPAGDARAAAAAGRLLNEHEMGELFKVLALGRGVAFAGPGGAPLGFVRGDRTHRL